VIRQRRGLWPIPTDTATDRARTIARALLVALQKADPAAATRICDQAVQFGELWLTPTLDTVGETRRVTVAEAAALTGRRPATIRQWISRGTRHGRLVRGADGRVDERELLDLDAAMRRGTPDLALTAQEGARP
jgi:hypothetical protein